MDNPTRCECCDKEFVDPDDAWPCTHHEPDGTPDTYYLCRNCMGIDPKET